MQLTPRSSRLAALALCLLLAPAARAATVDLVWTATSGGGVTGGSEITAAPGDTLTLTMRLTLGAGESLSLYSASIRFDTDLADELDLVSVTELSPTDPNTSAQLTPFDTGPASTQESELGVQEGNVLSCEAFTLGAGITTAGAYDLCRFEFTVTDDVNRQDPNLESGLFNGSFDGFSDDDDLPFTPTFNGASVDAPLATPALGPAGSLLLASLLTGSTACRLRRRASDAADPSLSPEG
jgi:hypothetical protein